MRFVIYKFSASSCVGGDLADDLLKRKGLIPKPQKKPSLPRGSNLDMGRIPQSSNQGVPTDQSDEGNEGEQSEGEEDQEESGGEQGRKKPEEKKGEQKPDGGSKEAADTGAKAAQGAEAGAGEAAAASEVAGGAAAAGEAAAAGGAAVATGETAALVAEAGTGVGLVLVAATLWKKFGKYILMGFAFIILTIAALVSCSMLERGSGGSAPKTPTNMLDNKIGLIDLRTYGGLDKLKEYTSGTAMRQNEILDTMMNMINKENPNVRGSSQKTKILSLLDQYKQKLQKLKDYVTQIQSLQLNIKPEESLTEDEFNKRNNLQNNINATYLELADLMTQLKKEFNKCDAIGSQVPNSNGFYHLEDGGPYQKFVTSSANTNREPFYLEAMPYCATIYIANQFQVKTGQKLWVGEGSLADGSAMGDLGSSLGHLDGRSIIYSGPGIAKNSKEIFGVDYNSDLAQWFAQLLYASGTGLVYFNDTKLNNQTTNNLLGDTVPLAASSSGVDNHWNVTFSFPDL